MNQTKAGRRGDGLLLRLLLKVSPVMASPGVDKQQRLDPDPAGVQQGPGAFNHTHLEC